MMPSMIPAPAPAPKLGFDGGPQLTFDRKTGLYMVAGVGLIGSIQAGKLELDAKRIDPPEEFSLFKAGTIAAGTLGTWANNRVSHRALVAALEANIGTAQTTADPANYYAVKIADANGASAVLPLTTAGATHYVLNSGGSGQVIAQYVKGQTATSPGGGRSNEAQVARGSRFTPTQDLTVTGFRYEWGFNNYGAAAGPYQVRCSLMNDDWSVIDVAYDTPPAATLDYTFYFAFPQAHVLKNGTPYRIAVDYFASNDGNNTGPYDYAGNSGTTQSVPLTSHIGEAFSVTLAKVGTHYQGQWADLVAAGGKVSYGNVSIWATDSSVYNSTGNAALLGTGGQTVMAGDLTLSVVTVGTPVGTAAGADLNVRALLNPV